jgi:hypothetical protein
MLQVTADMYSGRTNPSWLVTDEKEIRASLRELSRRQSSIANEARAAAGLGELRGMTIDVQDDEAAMEFGLPASLYLPLGGKDEQGGLHQIAERLIAAVSVEGLQAAATEFSAGDPAEDMQNLRQFLDASLRRSGISAPDASSGAVPEDQAEGWPSEAAAAVTCTIELGAFNPGFWNNDPNIRSRNNCYNYASNKRTDTFAQPGRGSGQIYTAITCPAVSQAALRDGLNRRYVCFPDSEKPRYLVALVVAPGPSFVDFHWYRKNKEGFWSHKPGGTAARNTDNSGRVISDPATCNRGPYTQFCGYFYTCRSQRIR